MPGPLSFVTTGLLWCVGEVATGTGGWKEARDTAKHAAEPRTALVTDNCPAPNTNRAEVEESCCIEGRVKLLVEISLFLPESFLWGKRETCQSKGSAVLIPRSIYAQTRGVD